MQLRKPKHSAVKQLCQHHVYRKLWSRGLNMSFNQAIVLHLMGLRIGNLVPNMRCDAEDSKTTKFQASP